MKSKRIARDELSDHTEFKRETKPQNSTETALFYTVCYGFVIY